MQDVADNMESLEIVGIPVLNLERDAAYALLAERLSAPGLLCVAFLNAHCGNVAQRDETYQSALKKMLVLPDGVGVDLAARILHGKPFVENLNGTDFTPALLDHFKQPLKVALYGAEKGVAERARDAFSLRCPRHDIRVMGDGFIEAEKQRAMLEELEAWQADLLLVAKGVPAQEVWMSTYLNENHCRLAIGVGALFDFMAGRVSRAPVWVRSLRLEWLYRLILEPRRLWRRYVLGNPLFLYHVLSHKFRGRS